MHVLQVKINLISGQNDFNLGWFLISLFLVFIITNKDKEITNQPRLKSFWPETNLAFNTCKLVSEQDITWNIYLKPWIDDFLSLNEWKLNWPLPFGALQGQWKNTEINLTG